MFRLAVLTVSICFVLPAYAEQAGRRVPADDAARARRGVTRGEYVALQGLIDDAQRRYPGRLIDVDLDDDEYEIEILREDGVVVELEYDARTGKFLDAEIDD